MELINSQASSKELTKDLETNWLMLNPKQIRRSLKRVKTVDDAIFQKGKVPTLATICKDNDREVSELVISSFIIDLCNFLGFEQTMNEEQIEETSELFYDEFYILNLADLKVLFQDLKRGKFGKFFNRIDGASIIEKSREYFEVRQTKYSVFIRKEHKHQIQAEKEHKNIDNESVRANYAKLLKKLEAKGEGKKEEDKATRQARIQKNREEANEFYKNWERLYYENNPSVRPSKIA